MVKNLPANVGDVTSPETQGRSSGMRKGTLLQYSCLENPMDKGAWRATVYGVTQSRTRLRDQAHLLNFAYNFSQKWKLFYAKGKSFY